MPSGVTSPARSSRPSGSPSGVLNRCGHRGLDVPGGWIFSARMYSPLRDVADDRSQRRHDRAASGGLVPLASSIVENAWYRLDLSVFTQVATQDTLHVEARVKSHTDPSNPNSLLPCFA